MNNKSYELISGDGSSDDPVHHLIIEVIEIVNHHLTFSVINGDPSLIDVSPIHLVRLIMTNLTISLLQRVISINNTTIVERLSIVEKSLDEIKTMAMKLWFALEAELSDDKKAH